eukprot:NODE_30_length_32972_cov_0.541052.p20 type:complete len:117 gc:universal NODE_30_length_32972_cov_0.541052:28416-28766(+)
MKSLQVFFIASSIVAENIITCLFFGQCLKMSCTSWRMRGSPNILSHSSSTKNLVLSKMTCFSLTNCFILPGVATIMDGLFIFRASKLSLKLIPPKTTSVLTSGKYFEKRSNSFLIW